MAGYRPQNGGNKSTQRYGVTVSRRLRTAGINVSPAARRYQHLGVFVAGRGDYISILVDLGTQERSKGVAEEIAEIVRGWRLNGPEVEAELAEDHAWVRFYYRTDS